jgi:hypothetical protein
MNVQCVLILYVMGKHQSRAADPSISGIWCSDGGFLGKKVGAELFYGICTRLDLRPVLHTNGYYPASGWMG